MATPHSSFRQVIQPNLCRLSSTSTFLSVHSLFFNNTDKILHSLHFLIRLNLVTKGFI